MKFVTDSPIIEDVPPTGQRSFSLNSPEAYDALCEPIDRPWIPNGALPCEPRWPPGSATVRVLAESETDASDAFKSWLADVEAGRIGQAVQ
jgi:hypothetical protein